jgi:hypothetical protein
MSLGFPTNPNIGDQYTVGETTYEWNGFAWIRVSGSISSATVGYFELLYVTSTTNATSTGTGRNIRSVNVGNIRYEVTGTAPNRKLIVQWNKFSRYATSAPSDLLNFQIVLEETTNKVSFVYDIPYIFTSTSITPQIGLRGASNADFNNRKTTTDWSATTAGTTNADNCTFTNVVFPASGQTYTWTPPSCIAPGGITTSLTSTTSANISWNASASATSGYDYYVSTVNTAPTVGTTPTASTTLSSTESWAKPSSNLPNLAVSRHTRDLRP